MEKNYQILVAGALLSALTLRPAQAQTNFRPGYVLPLTGDTLRGEVDYRDGRLNAQRCRFRSGPRGTVVTYAPAQLRGYGFPSSGEYYRPQIVPAGDSLLPAGSSHFMEVLTDGPAQLYYLRSEQGYERFFVVSPNLPLTLLGHGVRTAEHEGRQFQEELTPFRQTLAHALAGCAVAQSKLPNLQYSEGALRRVVTLYNNCQQTSRPMPLRHDGHVLVARVGILVGGHKSQLRFKNGAQFTTPQLPAYAGVIGGISLGLSAPRATRNVSLQLAVLYEQQRYNLEYIEPYRGGIQYEQHSRIHVDLSYLRVPVLLRYTYPHGKVRPLVEAGLSSGYAFKTDNTYQTTDYRGQYNDPRALAPDENIRRLEFGFSGGAGLMTTVLGGRNISLLARAETGNGFINSGDLSASIFRLVGLLSVDLSH